MGEKNGGCLTRVGQKLHGELMRITEERLKKHGLKGRMSLEQITNLIVRHKEGWIKIADDIINITPEEFEKIKNGKK